MYDHGRVACQLAEGVSNVLSFNRFLMVLVVLLVPAACSAQVNEDMKTLKEEVQKLADGQKEIQKELEAIRALLTPPERPLPTSLDLTSDDTPFRGEKTA